GAGRVDWPGWSRGVGRAESVRRPAGGGVAAGEPVLLGAGHRRGDPRQERPVLGDGVDALAYDVGGGIVLHGEGIGTAIGVAEQRAISETTGVRAVAHDWAIGIPIDPMIVGWRVTA